MTNAKTTPQKPIASPVSSHVKVTLIRSATRRVENQALCLRGLGLKKLHRSRILENTPSVQGMINKVKHLLLVEDSHSAS